MRKTEASMEKCSWIKGFFLGFGFHLEEDAEECLDFPASGFDKRGFLGGGKPNASDRDRFGIGDGGGVEDGDEVGGSSTGSSGGGEDEERVDLLLLLYVRMVLEDKEARAVGEVRDAITWEDKGTMKNQISRLFRDFGSLEDPATLGGAVNSIN